jgi:hypothetical protein
VCQPGDRHRAFEGGGGRHRRRWAVNQAEPLGFPGCADIDGRVVGDGVGREKGELRRGWGGRAAAAAAWFGSSSSLFFGRPVQNGNVGAGVNISSN